MVTVFCDLMVLRDFQRLAQRRQEPSRVNARRWNHVPSTASWAGGRWSQSLRWLLAAGGCTSPMEYVRNGFKVGPNYQPAPAPVAATLDRRLRRPGPQRVAGPCPLVERLQRSRVEPPGGLCLPAEPHVCGRRAFACWRPGLQLAIARGELFPQTQTASGGYIAAGVGAGSGGSCGRAPRSSTSGTSASTSPGSSTSGAGCGGRSSPARTTSTPRWPTTTRPWSPCWATSPRTTWKSAPTRSASSCCAAAWPCSRAC